MADDIHKKTLSQIAAGLNTGQYSSVELTKYYLQRIKNYNKKINAVITVSENLALEQAEHADELIAKKQATTLTGIPILHKDIFCTQGIKTTCASRMLDNFIAPYDATVVTKFKQAGAVTLGKTNMDEFAMGSSNENSYYGVVHNPWQHNYVPGGSSGGSAAAMAARFALGITASDTGGSIRQPAAFCGVTGIKPTYGLVSRHGMVAFASSLDQAGPMAASAFDCAQLLQVMAGFDPKDSTSVNVDIPKYSEELGKPITEITLGIPEEFIDEGLHPDILRSYDNAIKELEKLKVKIKKVSLPNIKLAIPVYYIIAPAEASSNLARYDGIRYGYRSSTKAKNLEEFYMLNRAEGFGDEVKRRILIGTYVLSSGYYQAYYIKAQKIRRILANDFNSAFQQVDAIIAPTTPQPAFKHGDKNSDPISMYLNDIYTAAINLAGLPALSMPTGFSNNLPIGVQIIGNYFQEAQILNIAHQFQRVTDWHTRIPPEMQT